MCPRAGLQQLAGLSGSRKPGGCSATRHSVRSGSGQSSTGSDKRDAKVVVISVPSFAGGVMPAPGPSRGGRLGPLPLEDLVVALGRHPALLARVVVAVGGEV